MFVWLVFVRLAALMTVICWPFQSGLGFLPMFDLLDYDRYGSESEDMHKLSVFALPMFISSN